MIVEIVILALIAAFLGLRLYSVLGKRAEHEEEGVPRHLERSGSLDGDRPVTKPVTVVARTESRPLEGAVPATERGVREIAAVDQDFDITGFLDGAKGAYAMILEAFWNGDRETLRALCDDDVFAGFDNAIEQRKTAGETLDNKLIRIEDATIRSAELDGRMARVAVLFVADIATVTRDRDGMVVAGSLDDAIESRDIWTFSRNVESHDPNWLLDETDEG